MQSVLLLSALSTVSSLVDQAATSASKAIDPPPQPDNASPAATVKASLPSVAINPGPPVPKFDKHTHVALLAAQAHLRV